MRVPGSLVRVFEAEGSHDGFRYGTLVLLGSASSFVQRLELALNGAGAPGCFNFSKRWCKPKESERMGVRTWGREEWRHADNADLISS